MRLFLIVAQITVFGTLICSGIGHLRHLGLLRKALELQGVVPPVVHGPIAASVVATELLVGTTGAVATLAPAGYSLVAPATISAAAGTLFLIYALFTAALLKWRPGAPCGCDHRHAPVGPATVARSATFGIVSVLSAFVAVDRVGFDAAQPPGELFVAVCASCVFIAISMNMPSLIGRPAVQS